MHLQWPLIREDYNRNRQTTALFSMDAVIRGHGIGVRAPTTRDTGDLVAPQPCTEPVTRCTSRSQLPATSTPYSALPPVAWGPVT